MDMRATGTFTVAKWDEGVAIDLPVAAKVTHASIVQEFEGDLEAIGTAELLMYYADENTTTIVGFQRFEGSLAGREGTFLARYEGEYDGTTATGRLTVIPGSASGALTELHGEGTAAARHEPPGTYEFEFTLR